MGTSSNTASNRQSVLIDELNKGDVITIVIDRGTEYLVEIVDPEKGEVLVSSTRLDSLEAFVEYGVLKVGTTLRFMEKNQGSFGGGTIASLTVN